jgi:hypothetical protein
VITRRLLAVDSKPGKTHREFLEKATAVTKN